MIFFIQKAFAQAVDAAEGQGDETFINILSSIVQVMLSVFVAFLILVASFLFAKILSHYIIGKLRDTHGETLHEDAVILVRRMVMVGIVAIGMGIAFQYVLGFDILQLIGFFGLGVGFAFKDILSNLLAGVIVLMQGRFHIGDFIEIGGKKGKVVEIQTRATILKALDGTEIIIPNADFLSKTVTSFTTNPTRRVEVEVGVHYNSDLELASRIINDVVRSNERVLPSPKPKVIAKSFSESSILLAVRFWVQIGTGVSWVVVKSQVVHAIKKAFQENGITIPFPIRTIHQGSPEDGLAWQNIPQAAQEAPEAPEEPQAVPEAAQEAPQAVPETPEAPMEPEAVQQQPVMEPGEADA